MGSKSVTPIRRLAAVPPPLRILLAPDKFKGSLTASGFCESVTSSLSAKLPQAEIRSLPLADGGDGTLDVLRAYLNLRRVEVATVDPLGRSMRATYLADDSHAFVEVAAASGLALLAEAERDPMRTSTYGTGLLVRHALAHGCHHLTLLLGGSATHDLGLGIAQALGVELTGIEGHATGAQLPRILAIRLPAKPSWSDAMVTLLCDVDSPIYGPRGAAHVYAKQKGATPEQIRALDEGSRHVATLLRAFAKIDIARLAGGGAAGGIGAGLVALLGAEIKPGFATIAGLTDLDDHIAWADVVITGEGQLDEQSFRGKVVGEVLARCKASGKPCYLLVGHNALPDSFLLPNAARRVIALTGIAPTQASAMAQAQRWLVEAGRVLADHVHAG